MAVVPLFPQALNAVTAWLDGLGEGVAKRVAQKESVTKPRVWRLEDASAGMSLLLVLQHDFPVSPARIEFDSALCLQFPHIERDGHLCHGVQYDPHDLEDPVGAVKRVLQELKDYFGNCQNPGWREHEFNRESRDYWGRRDPLRTVPKDYRTEDLLLHVDPRADGIQEGSALILPNGRALATLDAEPEKFAKVAGWPVGTITRGGVLVARLPAAEWWTPSSWPKTFPELDELVSRIAGTEARLTSWVARRWPNKAGIFVVLLHGPVAYGWRVVPAQPPGRSIPAISPVEVKRIDRQWALSRDQNVEELDVLGQKRVVFFGAGSLGSVVVELLARAGVGHIDVVDLQAFEPENISRHVLGLSSVDDAKATALCKRIQRDVPSAELTPFPQDALTWLANAVGKPVPDLVVDCTGERSVRVGTALARDAALDGAPVLMAWMEPFCAAAHAVVVAGQDHWPVSDPAETAVNIGVWPDGLEISMPACSAGFHPYGMADTFRVAGMIAERALSLLNASDTQSGILSFVRHKDYFLDAAPGVSFNREPPTGEGIESVTMKRSLKDAQ